MTGAGQVIVALVVLGIVTVLMVHFTGIRTWRRKDSRTLLSALTVSGLMLPWSDPPGADQEARHFAPVSP